MNVSVIIPIYNACKFLPNLFESLDRISFEEGDEVLLIDNGSTDDSQMLCKKQEEKKPKLYQNLSFTIKAGSYSVRNFGVERANNELLVFTDADTKPDSSWIDAIKKSAKPGVIIAGKIQLELKNKSLWELYDNLTHLNSEKNAQNNNVATANMSVLKADFYKIGFFEERFSGGDYEWSKRAANGGFHIEFNKNALVFHPSRNTFEQILKKEQRIAYGMGNHYRIHKKSLLILMMRYFAKIFKLDTNVRLHFALKKHGASKIELMEFDRLFWKIRICQLIYAIRGYKMINARNLGIK